jgi:hypothetical protein
MRLNGTESERRSSNWRRGIRNINWDANILYKEILPQSGKFSHFRSLMRLRICFEVQVFSANWQVEGNYTHNPCQKGQVGPRVHQTGLVRDGQLADITSSNATSLRKDKFACLNCHSTTLTNAKEYFALHVGSPSLSCRQIGQDEEGDIMQQ